MDLTTTTEGFGTRSRPWLQGDAIGAVSIALDQSRFAANDPRWPGDVLPSGLLVAAIIGPSAPEYGPWVKDATNGQQLACGVLLNPVKLNRALSGVSGSPSPDGINRTSVAMLRQGQLVYEELVAINPDLSDAATPLWASPAVAQAILPAAGDTRFVGLGMFTFTRRVHG